MNYHFSFKSMTSSLLCGVKRKIIMLSLINYSGNLVYDEKRHNIYKLFNFSYINFLNSYQFVSNAHVGLKTFDLENTFISVRFIYNNFIFLVCII